MPTLRTIPSTAHPENIALAVCNGGVRLSYADLRSRCEAVRAVLARWCAPGRAVAVVLPNTLEFVVTYIASTWARCVAAPLNAAYTPDEFEFYMGDAGVAVVVVPRDGNANAEAAARKLGLRVVTAVADAAGNVALTPKTAEDAAIAEVAPTSEEPREEDMAMFLHTSGTTSKPKCVQLTHANLAASAANIASAYELGPQDRSLLVMPLFHVHGLIGVALATLSSGGMVALPSEGRFSASTFWQSAVEVAATWYSAVPTIHQILLARAEKEYPRANPPALRFIRSCSSALAPAVLERLEREFGAPVLEAYAMTEASHMMTTNPLPKHGAHKAGTVGRAAPGVQVTILAEHCAPVAVGVPGEVCVRGPGVTPGYRNRPEANVEAFEGGWLHTGDQGFLDAEGYLTLTGRLKEMINRGGEKVSPLEVDAALLSHPEVAEAVCFAAPDDKYGEEVNAAVVLRPGAAGRVDAAAVIAHCSARLAAFKVPKRVFFAETLPRTATGKIQRRHVATHFLHK
eukprot:m51a1_g6361 putative 4-coumarate-ligase (514) ;mRNA; f:103035-104655